MLWYVNDVYIAEYHFTIHKEGHSAFYEYVKENVTASMSLGIWDTEKNNMVSNHVDIGDMNTLKANQVYAPRITVYNNGTQTLEHLFFGAITNTETLSEWSNGYSLSPGKYQSYVDDSAKHCNGSNQFVFYMNGIEIFRGSYVIRSAEKQEPLTATAKGFMSTVKVTLTLNLDGTIASITADVSGETQFLAAPCAEEKFLSQFIGRKGPFEEIDAVSGATFTSEAIATAVNSLFPAK